MSTKASILWHGKNGVHVYEEMNDRNAIYIEIERGDMCITAKLMERQEWVMLGLPTKYIGMSPEEQIRNPAK